MQHEQKFFAEVNDERHRLTQVCHEEPEFRSWLTEAYARFQAAGQFTLQRTGARGARPAR